MFSDSKSFRKVAKAVAGRFGLEIRRTGGPSDIPPDFTPEDVETLRAVRPFTMTTPERVFSLIRAVEYIVEAGITGSFVECGVWRGGSMMTIALTLKRLGVCDADLYLFDTFDGMTPPTEHDVGHDNHLAKVQYDSMTARDEKWCYASLDDVRTNLASTGYPADRLHFIRGPVEQTIPAQSPDSIALLRLDTDWYASTKHELEHLYPLLQSSGVLIIDDYGHWKGSRQATDEYRAAHGIRSMLHRVDQTCRVTIKP